MQPPPVSTPAGRRSPRLPMLGIAALATALLLAAQGPTPASSEHSSSPSGFTPVACIGDPATPKRQFRAMWISTVVNIDWPSTPGLSVSAQQAEYRGWLDLAVTRRMNAVVVQIRPTADAFWPSSFEPWSAYLTGTQGVSPGYDPLAYLVSEAHKRNLEFHAWFNPYRVSMDTNVNALVASHPARQHPNWIFPYEGKLYYNPGIPAVRDFVQDAMMDAVTKYNIDGVHWDDYFYPYPGSGSLPDAATFASYGGGFSDINDWRRNNVDLLVQEMNSRIKAVKPWVKFGISPFGIWRNASTDPNGSATAGLQSYDAIYADSRKWVKQGWIDYITPQIYWHIGFDIADYAVLTPWWADVVAGTDVQLYIGQATYRVGASGQAAQWQSSTELTNHLLLNRDYPQVLGDVHFSAKDVRADRLGGFGKVVTDHYSRRALVPQSPLGGTTPAAPTISNAVRGGSGVTLTVNGGGTAYAVYRVNGSGPAGACAFFDATNLIGSVRGSGGTSTSYLDTTAQAGSQYTYYVSALNRQHAESGVSAGRTISGSFSAIVDNTTAGRFTASANWATSAFSTQRYGADYRYANPQSVSDAAWYKVNIPSTGSYKVEIWYPANAGYNSATPFVVATTSGSQTVVVDQRTGGGAWVSLGTFTLAGGDANVVGVSRWTSGAGYVIADAVRVTSA